VTALIRDERDGVATLLQALAAIDGLDTVECRDRDAIGNAYVLFRYGHSSRDLSVFVADLNARFRATAPQMRFFFELERIGGGTELLARLEFSPDSGPRLAEAFRAARVRRTVET
jgi:hypothetical protein